jgi:HK97 gp10 family phage protein
MTTILTTEELIQRLRNLPRASVPAVRSGMRTACLNVVGEAKRNCTPGQTPYAKAPYSDDNDPRREPPHMRDVMGYRVTVSGTTVRGIVGNKKSYAHWVHDGTKKMPARSFITDAIKAKQGETRAILSNALEIGILQAWRGELFTGGLGQGGFTPTMPDFTEDDEA